MGFLNKEDQELLRKLFYGQGLRDLQVLRGKAPSIPYDALQQWYQNQEVVQLIRPPPLALDRSGISYKPIIAWKPFSRFYMDTMFFRDIGVEREKKKKRKKKGQKSAPPPLQGLTIVCGLDLFSRYAFVYPIFGEIGINASQALDAIKQFIKEIKALGYDIETLYTDAGGEFKSIFKTFIDNEKIPSVTSAPNDPRKNRNIERFNRTLRTAIEKWILLYGKGIRKQDVQKLVADYNSTVHRSLIGFTPLEVLKDKKKSEELWSHYVNLKYDALGKKEFDVLEKGTHVRVYIRGKDAFKKIAKNWSKALYTVEEYQPATKLYKLVGKPDLYRREYLQVVDPALFKAYNWTPPSSAVAEAIVLPGEKRQRKKKTIESV